MKLNSSITYQNFKKVDMDKLKAVCDKFGARIDTRTKKIWFNTSDKNAEFFKELDGCVIEQ